MPNLFDSNDYKKYLVSLIESRPNQGWGFRSEMASAMSCQSAYLSRVLNGGADLSLEQADQLSKFLGHSEEEAEYFLVLVELVRAGTSSLKTRYEKRKKEILEKRLVLKDRFKVKATLSKEDQVTYYSAWYYAATHAIISIPGYQTKEAISKALSLAPARVSQILSFLVATGLAIEKSGRYRVGETRLHVGTDSPLLSKHLLNWRLQAMQSVEKGHSDNLHYTGVITLSHADATRMRSILVDAIEKCNQLIAPSPEEQLRCFSIDFFNI